MREASGVILIIVALFLGYLAVTGKYKIVTEAFRKIADLPVTADENAKKEKSYLEEMLDVYRGVIPFPE